MENVETTEDVVKTTDDVIKTTDDVVETVEEIVESVAKCIKCGSSSLEEKISSAKVDLAEAVIAGVHLTDVTLVFNNVSALTCGDCGQATVLDTEKAAEISGFLNQLTHNE